MVRVGKIKFVDIYAENQTAKHRNEIYVIYNTKKKFNVGHTHVKNYKTAEYLAKLIVSNQLPKNCHSTYLLESLIRLETNPDHIKILQGWVKKNKKHY